MKQNLPKVWMMILTLGLSCTLSVSAGAVANPSEKDGVTESQTQTSQTQPVKVVVKDDAGDPVVGAVVAIKGTQRAKATGVDGDVEIAAKTGEVLTISYLGYKTQEITLGTQSTLNVVLVTEAVGIDEVVVVGYGTQKKANLTGAVSMVNMEKVLGDRPVTNVMNALQGAIPGLNITSASQPGNNPTFNIRGFTSINGGGPLVLIDNVPGSLELVNPEDIESVSVLKDAASSAIYGARAAFGVILVTTKRAKKNTRLQLNYNDNFGFNVPTNLPEQASIKDILTAFKEADFKGNGKYQYGQDLDAWMGYLDEYNANPSAFPENGIYNPTGGTTSADMYYLRRNNEYEDMTDAYGFQQTHNLSASGGSERITYRMSLGFTENDGPLITSKDRFSRINVTSFVSADITKWLNQSLDVRYAKGKKSAPGASYSLTHPAFYPNGQMMYSDGQMYDVDSPANYIKNSVPTKNNTDNTRIFSRTTITPLKGLEGVFEYTYDRKDTDYKAFNPNKVTYIRGSEYTLFPGGQSSYSNNKSNTDYNAINAYISYTHSFKNEHNLKVMAGYNQEMSAYHVLNVTRKDMISTSAPSISGGIGEITSSDAWQEYSTRGAFFRVNYNYREKYLFEVSGRYDGSSRFPTDTRFGFFPSGSLGWQLGQEEFMAWSDSWLDEFKIRASWGQIGNQSIPLYGYNGVMGTYRADWLQGGEKPMSFYPPSLIRSNFTWERVENIDLGADLALFNQRLNISGGWFQRDTKGMLAPGSEIPAIVGAPAPLQNVSDLRTRGWELTMSWRDRVGDWGYNVGFNISDSRTHIMKYENAAGLFDEYRVGQEIGEIWGFESDGFYKIEDFVSSGDGVKGWQDDIWALKDGVVSIKGNSALRPGDLKYKNLVDSENSINRIDDGENTVKDPGDRKVIGNNRPRYQYGINAGVSWKGIELTLMFQGVGKRDLWMEGALAWPFAEGGFGTVFDDQTDYWVSKRDANGNRTYEPENPNAKYQRLYGAKGTSDRRIQTKYLADAAYIRLKNLTISYSVPRAAMQKIGMTGAKVFFSAENLFTWSKLPKGYDPERWDPYVSLGTEPTKSGWGYPSYQTFSFGVSLTL